MGGAALLYQPTKGLDGIGMCFFNGADLSQVLRAVNDLPRSIEQAHLMGGLFDASIEICFHWRWWLLDRATTTPAKAGWSVAVHAE